MNFYLSWLKWYNTPSDERVSYTKKDVVDVGDNFFLLDGFFGPDGKMK